MSRSSTHALRLSGSNARAPPTLSAPIDAPSAAVLGVVQGLTEFLPVSSSGHVAIGAAYFGLQEGSLALTIVLHLGTLIATLILFRRDVADLLSTAVRSIREPRTLRDSADGQTFVGIAIATLITAAIGFGLRDLAEAISSELHLVAWGFLISAMALLLTRGAKGRSDALSTNQAALVGLAQGIAVLPGISRSGMTIAVALLLGIRGPEAFRFSFLASLPAIAGAALYEAVSSSGFGTLGLNVWIGGLTALVTGYLALVLLRQIVLVGRMWMFALYLVPLALLLMTR